MSKKDNQQPSTLSKIPRAWGIQILLLFLLVAPQAFVSLIHNTADLSPVVLILVCFSGYTGWLVWTKSGQYPIHSTQDFFYVEAKQADCGGIQRACWHLTMGLMLILVFITLRAFI